MRVKKTRTWYSDSDETTRTQQESRGVRIGRGESKRLSRSQGDSELVRQLADR